MNKLSSVVIKLAGGGYSGEIPVSATADNIVWDATYTLRDVLGSIDMTKGNLQAQLGNVDMGSGEGRGNVQQQLDWIKSNMQGTLTGGNGISITNGKIIVKKGDGLAFDSNGQLKIDFSQVAAKTHNHTAGEITDLTDHVAPKTHQHLVADISGLATTTSDGLMPKEDKAKLDGADVTAYENGNGINISNHKVAVKLNSSAKNGLSVSSSGLGLALATPSASGSGGSAGAMSAADKEKLDGLSTDNLSPANIKTAGTLGAKVQANVDAQGTFTNNTSTAQVRDITISKTDLVAGSSTLAKGSVYIVYS